MCSSTVVGSLRAALCGVEADGIPLESIERKRDFRGGNPCGLTSQAMTTAAASYYYLLLYFELSFFFLLAGFRLDLDHLFIEEVCLPAI